MGGAPIPIHYMHDLFSEGTSFCDVLDEQTRRRLAVYCMKDAILPPKLMCMCDQLHGDGQGHWVPLGYLLMRGQQVSQLLRKVLVCGSLPMCRWVYSAHI